MSDTGDDQYHEGSNIVIIVYTINIISQIYLKQMITCMKMKIMCQYQ